LLSSRATYLLLPLVIAFTQDLQAQNPGISGIHAVITRVSTEQGLSNTVVHAITQDNQGFIWIGTAFGLNRFDGHNFTVYTSDPNDSTSLSHDLVWSLFVDRSGILWVGTQHGLNKFDPVSRTFKKYFHDPSVASSLSDNEVRSFYEDRSGVFWVGTAHGLNRFERNTETWKRFLPTPNDSTRPGDNFVNAILEDREGTFWIGTGGFLANGGGLHKFDRHNNSFSHYWHKASDPQSLSGDWVSSLLQDRSGTLWVTADGDVNKFDKHSGSVIHLSLPNEESKRRDPIAGNFIREDSTGALWISTWGWGLFRYDTGAGTFTRYTYDASNPATLSNPAINTLFVDRAGLLWVGTDRGGVNTVATKSFVHRHTIGNSIRIGSRVDGLFTDIQGSLWIGAVEAGVWQLDTKTQKTTHILRNGLANEICQDSAGAIWISTLDQVVRYDPKAGTSAVAWITPVRHGTQEFICRLFLDSRGALWIGTTGCLYKIQQAKKDSSVFVHNPGNYQSLTAGQVNSILEDRLGRIWVSTAEGLSRFNRETQSFTRFTHDSKDSTSLSSDYWPWILEDRSGTIWVGTVDGLNRFNESSSNFSRFYPADQGRSRAVSRMLEDGRGRLWYSSGGISMFDPVTGKFTCFDESDGLGNLEVLGWSCTRLQSGEMLFGTANGILVFHPDNVKASSYIPPVVVTGVEKFNQPMNLASSPEIVREIAFKHEENVFSIEFAALSYDMSEFNQYAYKLEGFDKDWVYCGNMRKATYTNLDPGRYKFRAKGSNHDGLWNEEGTSLAIIITPPWWSTWWFTVLFWSTVVFSVGGTIRYVEMRKIRRTIERLEQEKALERERSRISQDLHDDIGASLSRIALFSEVAKEEALASSPRILELSQKIGDNARELLDAVGALVWSIDPRHEKFEDLVTHMKNFAQEMFTLKNIDYRFKVDPEVAHLALPMDARKNILLIFKEAVNNIVKHSRCQTARVQFSVDRGTFTMTIEDDGEEPDRLSSHKGHGIDNMKIRAKNIHGEIRIDVGERGGTKVCLTVPVDTPK